MTDRRAVVTAYLDAVNRHDVDQAMRHLSDGFRLEFAGGPSMAKADMASMLGWDAGVEGRVGWEIVAEEASEVVVEGQETNEFFRLLDVGHLRFRSRFRVDDDGRITHQRHEVQSLGDRYGEVLAEAVAWAQEHEPEELAEIYPQGRLIHSEAMGRRWVALLRRWRKARGTRGPSSP